MPAAQFRGSGRGPKRRRRDMTVGAAGQAGGASSPASTRGSDGKPGGNGGKVADGGAKSPRRARGDERELAALETALRKAAAGDFKVRLPARSDDAIGRVQAAYNELAARNAALEAELVRVA